MADLVKAFDARGNRVLVPQEKLAELQDLGGRAATGEEIAARETQKAYEGQSAGAKAAGYLGTLGPVGHAGKLAYQAATGEMPRVAPELEAVRQGGGSALTMGLAALAEKEAIRAVGGDKAATAYEKMAGDVETAHPGYYTAGQVGGTVAGLIAGGAGGLGKLSPQAAINAAGEVVGGKVAGAVGKVAGQSVIGKAVAKGAGFAAENAVQNAVLAGAQYASGEMLHDRPIVGEKLAAEMGNSALIGAAFGGPLGAGGSLVRSGASAARTGLISGLGKAATKLDGALGAGRKVADDLAASGRRAADAVTDAAGSVKGIADEAAKLPDNALALASEAQKAGRKVASDVGENLKTTANYLADTTGQSLKQVEAQARDFVANAAKTETQKGWAYEQAWKSIGAGAGLQSTTYAKQAAKYLPKGTQDIGEVMMRKGIIDAEGGVVKAMTEGAPADMLEKFEKHLASTGSEIDSIYKTSGARIDGGRIHDLVIDIASEYERSAATKPAGKSLRLFGQDLLESLGVGARDAEGNFSSFGSADILDVVRERRAIDRMIFGDSPTMDPKLALELKRKLRSRLQGLIIDSVDEASQELGGEAGKRLRALNRDYTALSIASEAAEDSAARMAKGRSVSLTDYLAGGGSVVSTLGHKVVRERGNAAAAVLLSKAADNGSITKLLKEFDDRVSRAAVGAVRQTEPAAKVGATATRRTAKEAADAKASQRAVHQQAQAIVRWSGETKANPRAAYDRIQKASDDVSRSAGPQAAAAFTQTSLRALAFVDRHIPQRERRDPLDPRSVPPLTNEESQRLVRATRYAAKPTAALDDIGRGDANPEAIAAVQEFMPEAFQEFRMKLYDHLVSTMQRGERLSYSQRLRADKLLGVPAGPDLRPAALKRLQNNFVATPTDEGGVQSPGQTGAPTGGPVAMKIQQSGFDAVEARKS